MARDTLHAALGHDFLLKETRDTDLGLAVSDWAVINKIDAAFKRTGSNGIRYVIAATPVDVMPFGPIEDPEGISTPVGRGSDLNVFGFSDVHASSAPLLLPGGATIRLPVPAGYAALKMRAWIDRSAWGNDKDAPDLALATYWYQRSPEVENRLYDTDEGLELLEAADFDPEVAAAGVLGLDVEHLLSPSNVTDLRRRWSRLDLDLLASRFKVGANSAMNASREIRRSYVDQLVRPEHR